MMKTLVEEMLPARFLANYAVYLQTCAHLELTVWHIVLLARNEDTETDQYLAGHLNLRISAYQLRKALREVVPLCPPHLGLRVCNLANKVNDGYENRNTAAHGAWHVDRRTERLHVEHYLKRGKAPKVQFFHITEPFNQKQIDGAVEEADRLLRSAVDIRAELHKWRMRRGEALKTMIARQLSGSEVASPQEPYRGWIETLDRKFRRKDSVSSFWNIGHPIRLGSRLQ